jgi:hypothetical protein
MANEPIRVKLFIYYDICVCMLFFLGKRRADT